MNHPYTARETRNGQWLLVYEGGRPRRKMWWAAALKDDASDRAAFQRRARLRVVNGGRR